MKKVVLPLAVALGLSVGYNVYQVDTVHKFSVEQKAQSIKITQEGNEIVRAQRQLVIQQKELSQKNSNEQELKKRIKSLDIDVAKLEEQVTNLKK